MTFLHLRVWCFVVAGSILVLFSSACSGRLENVVDESRSYPPMPTSPAKDSETSLTAEGAQSPTKPSEPQIAADSPLQGENSQLPSATATVSITIPTTQPPLETEIPPSTPAPSPTPCSSPGQIETGYFDSSIAGRINYRIYLPPCYSDTGRTYPALYMLPGNIHTDSIWDELGLDEALEMGIKEERFPPMLIVMLSGGSLANTTSGGPGSYESFMIEEFIPFVERTYCVLPRGRGRAIGGLSRGGYWALEIAFRHPEEFASVGGHSAALVDFNGGPEINPLDTGLNHDLDDLRIYFDIGENDWLRPNVQELHEQMLSEGREHSWVLNEGIHEEAYWAAHVADYLEWYSEPWLNPEIIYPPCRAVSFGYSS
jgi:enterochelin esterase-like enzyme